MTPDLHSKRPPSLFAFPRCLAIYLYAFSGCLYEHNPDTVLGKIEISDRAPARLEVQLPSSESQIPIYFVAGTSNEESKIEKAGLLCRVKLTNVGGKDAEYGLLTREGGFVTLKPGRSVEIFSGKLFDLTHHQVLTFDGGKLRVGISISGRAQLLGSVRLMVIARRLNTGP